MVGKEEVSAVEAGPRMCVDGAAIVRISSGLSWAAVAYVKVSSLLDLSLLSLCVLCILHCLGDGRMDMAIRTFVIMLLVNQMHCRHGRQTYHHEAHLFEFYPRTPKS